MTLTLVESIRRGRPFEQERLLLRLAPFAIAYALVAALYPIGGPPAHGGWLIGAAVAAATTLLAIALVPWGRFPEGAQVLPLIPYLASIALLREAHGGATAGYAPLVLVAIVWVAIFGRRWMLAFVIAAAGLAIALPVLLRGPPEYPVGELRRAVLMALVGALCGIVIQALIRSLLAAEAHLKRIRADEIHDDLVQAFAAAQLALDGGNTRVAGDAVRSGLTAAQALSAQMLHEAAPERIEPGMLRRANSGE
jgi:signal transduction histidine kinase